MRDDGIKVDEVGGIIATATRTLESETAAVSSMVRSGNRFEHWWKFSMFHHFTLPPWSREPGYHVEDGAGVAVEHRWEVVDGRCAFTRRTGKGTKRVDLVVRKAAHGGQYHLIEMKLVDGSKNFGVADFQSVQADVTALRAVVGWDSVASCWAVALAHSFEDLAGLERGLAEGLDPDDAGPPRRWYFAAKSPHVGKLWVLGWRVT